MSSKGSTRNTAEQAYSGTVVVCGRRYIIHKEKGWEMRLDSPGCHLMYIGKSPYKEKPN